MYFASMNNIFKVPFIKIDLLETSIIHWTIEGHENIAQYLNNML